MIDCLIGAISGKKHVVSYQGSIVYLSLAQRMIGRCSVLILNLMMKALLLDSRRQVGENLHDLIDKVDLPVYTRNNPWATTSFRRSSTAVWFSSVIFFSVTMIYTSPVST